MTKIIEILVATDGNTTVQTQGFTGSSCRDASRFLEQVLGQRTSEQLTTEFHRAEASQSVQQHA
jgi:hypothetical protein